jgi:glutamine amidotransferase
MKNIAILDYGIGNVKSMLNAFENIGAKATLTANRDIILNADGLVLPGVGAFKKGMDNLKDLNLIHIIYEYVNTGKPFLGVCLGMQMLLEESEEFGITKGLGLIKGKVIRMPLKENAPEKLPHVSWNTLQEPAKNRWEHTILSKIPIQNDFYFVHSFVAKPLNEGDILATTQYGDTTFTAAVHNNNIFGTQFHPEKSGEMGFVILKKFINLLQK